MDAELNLLVIEDDPVDCKAVCRILRRSGLSSHPDTSHSLQDAKELARRGSYDAVILDLGLPDSQGVDGLLELQATAPELPIVVLTGNEDEDTALKSMGIGAEDFISKKFLTEENLRRALRFAVERHRRKSEVFRDMDSLRISLSDAVRQAGTDPLTALPNRRGLNSYLEQLSLSHPGSSVIVGVADLDKFKECNDTHGHAVGDDVLREFAGRLQHCLRAHDFAARIGGDEFVVILGGLSRPEAARLGERMLEHVSATPLQSAGKLVNFSATLALAEIEPPFIDLEQILLQTHRLLARGKEAGKARVECAWEEGRGRGSSRPKAAAAGENAPFDESLLVQHVRAVKPLEDGALEGYQLIYGIGPGTWPLVQPAVSRARLSSRLGEMTLQCMRRSQAWRQSMAPDCELHLDIEADAIKPWVATEMTRIFPDQKSRERCILFLHTDFERQPGAVTLADLRLLRQAGFKLGVRRVGDGSTIFEHLLLLSPDWIRLDAAITINAGHYEKKEIALRKIVAMLAPLQARLAADETEAESDLALLTQLGFHAYYSEERNAAPPLIPSS